MSFMPPFQNIIPFLPVVMGNKETFFNLKALVSTGRQYSSISKSKYEAIKNLQQTNELTAHGGLFILNHENCHELLASKALCTLTFFLIGEKKYHPFNCTFIVESNASYECTLGTNFLFGSTEVESVTSFGLRLREGSLIPFLPQTIKSRGFPVIQQQPQAASTAQESRAQASQQAYTPYQQYGSAPTPKKAAESPMGSSQPHQQKAMMDRVSSSANQPIYDRTQPPPSYPHGSAGYFNFGQQ